MEISIKTRANRLVAAITILAFVPQTSANNGLNLIGFGTESIAVAGADIAMAHDPFAINTNPAGLSTLRGQRLDLYGAVGYTLVDYSDSINPSGEESKTLLSIGAIGYSLRSSDHPVTYSVALFTQGGSGADYEGLNTIFETRDTLNASFGIGRLGGGVSYDVSEVMSIGAAASVTFAELHEELFPNTSFYNTANPSNSFFGFTLDDTMAINVGYKLGIQYKIATDVTLGAAYSSPVDLNLKDGQFRSNQVALGLGVVTYKDAEISGLGLPQEFGIGVAWRANPNLVVSAELSWLDWSSAMKTARIVAREPNNPLAVPRIVINVDHDWRDQYVFSVGVSYALSENTTLRAGYNHGNDPVPGMTLTPLLPSIIEHHITAGYEHRFTKLWSLGTALEYQINANERYANPSFPLAENTRLKGFLIGAHASLSRRW